MRVMSWMICGETDRKGGGALYFRGSVRPLRLRGRRKHGNGRGGNGIRGHGGPIGGLHRQPVHELGVVLRNGRHRDLRAPALQPDGLRPLPDPARGQEQADGACFQNVGVPPSASRAKLPASRSRRDPVVCTHFDHASLLQRKRNHDIYVIWYQYVIFDVVLLQLHHGRNDDERHHDNVLYGD